MCAPVEPAPVPPEVEKNRLPRESSSASGVFYVRAAAEGGNPSWWSPIRMSGTISRLHGTPIKSSFLVLEI